MCNESQNWCKNNLAAAPTPLHCLLSYVSQSTLRMASVTFTLSDKNVNPFFLLLTELTQQNASCFVDWLTA